jgi:hypothetical protein
MADQVLCSGISCITDLMVKEGLVNLDFADLCSVMGEMGTAMIGAGEAEGERRAHRAAEAAIANPLFDDASLNGARGVLISITDGKDLTLYEVDEAASRIREEVDEEANIIVGAIIDPALEHDAGVGRGDGRRSVGRSLDGRSALCRAGSPPKRCVGFAGSDRGSHRGRDSASPSARHPISRADGAPSGPGRGAALRSASNSTAVREILRRSVGKAAGSKSIGLTLGNGRVGDVGSIGRNGTRS